MRFDKPLSPTSSSCPDAQLDVGPGDGVATIAFAAGRHRAKTPESLERLSACRRSGGAILRANEGRLTRADF